MKALRCAAILLIARSGWAGYQYYFSDTLNSIDPNRWVTAGSLSPGSAGLAGPDQNGGSLISRIPIGDGSNDAEVRVTLALNKSGGTYTEFLQATADAKTSGAGSGSYLALQMQDPEFDSAGNCAADFLLLQSVGGTVSLVASFPHSCRDGMDLRLAVHGSVAMVWPDQTDPMQFPIASTGPGQPGVGVYGTPAGNGISLVRLGLIDRTPPPAIDPQRLTAVVFRNRIDLRWPEVADEAGGSGLAAYWIYRDNAYLARTSQPFFSDESVTPGASYTYTIYAVDQHFNFSAGAPVALETPGTAAAQGHEVEEPGSNARPASATPMASLLPGGGIDPRRIGVRSLGSYWGGAGEQVDTASGNLNFTLPLLSVKSRGGWGIGLSLSYNSQMWRYNSNADWLDGTDVGYGLGWKLLAGAVTPIWNNSQIAYYLFTDSSGAEYRLYQNANGTFTSAEGIYVTYDASANRVYMPDGSLWIMGCQSSGGEPDAGTLYPTMIEDSNGNQIVISYQTGSGASTSNTSARIASIQDPRYYGNWTYTFTYANLGGGRPHLTGITSWVQTPESYTLTYSASQSLYSPISGQNVPPNDPGGQAPLLLLSIGTTGLNIAHNFQYGTLSGGTTGELTQITTPLGAALQYAYATCNYATGVSDREVQQRYLTPVAGGTQYQWTLSFGTDNSSYPVHNWGQVLDAAAHSQKVWWFSTNVDAYLQLATAYQESYDSTQNYRATLRKDYTWTQDAMGNVYTGSVLSTLDPSPAQVQGKTVQTLDSYGNLTQSLQYDYGNLATPARTYNYQYLGGSNYAPRYIRNRLSSASVTVGSGNLTLASNSYDGGWLTDRSPLVLHDTTYDVNFQYRGNPTTVNRYGDVRNYTYEISGVVNSVTDGSGRTVTVSPSWGTGYSLPGVVTPGGNGNLATSLSYAASWAVASVSGPNGATGATTYDTYGRPQQTTIPDGAQTTYAYTYYPSANTQTATLGNRWKRTTLDGLGRTIRVETGHDGVTVSTVDTQYAPCACSPLGKLWRVSQPYAPGATVYWTTYTYDASGRTLTVTAPDGASTTHYAYQGNQTTVTDPAGKWKTHTTDAFGNLVAVAEPDPGGGANLTTNYAYNGANQLTSVTMAAQVRTFTWSGQDLASATNPENGTVTYAYDGAHRVTSRTDAKGQQTQYTYDTYGRVTEVRHYPTGWSNDDANQRWDYYYDSNPFDSGGYSTYTWGRLAAVQFGSVTGYPTQYMYSYNVAGRVTGQRLSAQLPASWYIPNSPIDLRASYAWDNEGRMTSQAYPWPVDWMDLNSSGTITFGYQYDSMGRLGTMNGDQGDGNGVSASASYGPAGELLGLTGSFPYSDSSLPFWETRTYNSLSQVTGISHSVYYFPDTDVNMQYVYSATQNNGRIVQSNDGVTGEQVTYQYDALNRLVHAETASSAWGESYQYDRFGNLTAKTPTKGSAPALSAMYDAATNRQMGVQYDANGNQLVGTWDVENRLVSENAPDGSTPKWLYDPWGKRVGKGSTDGNGNAIYEFTLYGITGQRLVTVGCYSDSPMCSTTRSNVYFNGRFLGHRDWGSSTAVGVDRLGSVRTAGTYWPYGEEEGTPTAGGQEKFATYFRDWPGQDYADQRYYSNNTGRFFSADPSMDNVDYANPASWNAYAYTMGDPVNGNDPSGLQTCGQTPIVGGAFNGQTVSQVFTGTSGNDLLAQEIWHEGGTIYSSDLTSQASAAAYEQDLAAIGTAILNQWDVDDGRLNVYQNGRAVCPLGQCLDRSLAQIIETIATYSSGGQMVSVFNSSGQMQGPAAATLSGILGTNIDSGPLVLDSSGQYVNQGCEGVLASLVTGSGLLGGTTPRVSPNGLTLLFWNQASATSTTTFPGNVGYTGWRDARTRGETFWGLSSTAPPPIRRPPPRRPL